MNPFIRLRTFVWFCRLNGSFPWRQNIPDLQVVHFHAPFGSEVPDVAAFRWPSVCAMHRLAKALHRNADEMLVRDCGRNASNLLQHLNKTNNVIGCGGLEDPPQIVAGDKDNAELRYVRRSHWHQDCLIDILRQFLRATFSTY